jgi:hypothetical protein
VGINRLARQYHHDKTAIRDMLRRMGVLRTRTEALRARNGDSLRKEVTPEIHALACCLMAAAERGNLDVGRIIDAVREWRSGKQYKRRRVS